MRWVETLLRRRTWTEAQIAALPTEELCREIARLQYDLVLEAARATYHRPPDDPARTRELDQLRASDGVLDRYAARLVARWDAADRKAPL